MPLEEPSWWYRKERTLASRLLAPISAGYDAAAVARYQMATTPRRVPVPVICVGNFTVGGTGKTPLARHIAAHLASHGAAPHFLTRGYGGSVRGPHWVDPHRDSASAVGDEALLLARDHPTCVARDRAAGAIEIVAHGTTGSVIVMDDGLQNPRISKDLTLAVIDGSRGTGNGRIFPAGPLRMRLSFQLGLTDTIVVNSRPEIADESAELVAELRTRFTGPVLMAETLPAGDTSWLADLPVVAFAGIGNPDRFFGLLRRLGAEVAAAVAFPDHHPLSDAESGELLALARAKGATLVTTEKDLARLSGAAGDGARLRDAVRVLPVRLAFNEHDARRLTALIEGVLA